MQISDDSLNLLIENPHTGNNSFAKVYGFNPHPTIPKHTIPDVARADFPEWSDAFKTILVRDPIARFESAATALVAGVGSGEWPDQFATFMQEFADVRPHPDERARCMLAYILSGQELPTTLKPQSNWLTAKFDLVLATHDIAEYFNDKGLHAQRSNQYAWNPLMLDNAVRCMSADTKAMVAEAYSVDYDTFQTLRVWGKDPDQVRLVTGYCPTCTAKMNERSPEESVVDSQDEQR